MTAPDTPRSWLARSGPLVGLVVMAALVRALTLAWAPPIALTGDELYYSQVAANLALGEGHVFREAWPGGSNLHAWRPPGHAALLAAVLSPDDARALDGSVQSAMDGIVLQIVFGSLLAGAACALGGALIDRRTGVAAGLGVALYPSLVVFSHGLWSETLAALLLTTALAIAVVAREARSPAAAIAVGAVLGAATLVREISLLVALACATWWVLEATGPARRRAIGHAALMLAILGACVAPWTLRNTELFGRLVPVSTIGWFATAEGNLFEADDWLRDTGPEHLAFNQRYFSQPGELERSDLAREQALSSIAGQQPGWIAKKWIRNGALLLSPDSYLLFKQAVGAYGDVTPAVRTASLWLVALSWGAAAALGAFGLSIAAPHARRLALLVLATPATVHLVSNATSRFRIPWIALWLVFAALGARELPSARQHWQAIPRWRRSALVAFLGFVFLVAFPYYAEYGGRR